MITKEEALKISNKLKSILKNEVETHGEEMTIYEQNLFNKLERYITQNKWKKYLDNCDKEIVE